MGKPYLGLVALFRVVSSLLCFITSPSASAADVHGGEQPLAKIAIHKTVLALRDSASIFASPSLLGKNVMSPIHYLLLPFNVMTPLHYIFLPFCLSKIIY